MSNNNLITITGGKWTSYRLMAEDTIDKAIHMGLVEPKKCVTKTLHIHGYRPKPNLADHCYVYGADEPALHQMEQESPAFTEKISPKYDYTIGEVVWAVREEMARTVDDVLARRVRMLFIDAREALAVAPKVAHVMAAELGADIAVGDGLVYDTVAAVEHMAVHTDVFRFCQRELRRHQAAYQCAGQ